MKRILITGAEGIIGQVLQQHLSDRYDLRLLRAPAALRDRLLAQESDADPEELARRPPSEPAGGDEETQRGPWSDVDISDFPAVVNALNANLDAVVHLAAAQLAPWGDILNSNIIGTYNIFEAARMNGIPLIVLASTNHVVGMYEEEAGPSLYELADARVYSTAVEPRPDSLYGASKIFCEALGRFYVDRYGMRVFCIRIGSCPEENDPRYASVWGLKLQPHEMYLRRRAAWLSHRDCAQLVSRCLEAPDDLRWAVVYGISDNPRQFWDLRPARDLLGYEPDDGAPVEEGGS
jgi:NAD+ dependent glucose-6-phosphate dehydrogenase